MTQEVPVQNPTSTTLADGDYVANDGCWISIRGFAVRIVPTDTGIDVAVYKDGDEMGDSVAETWATYGMIQVDPEEF